MSKTDIRPQSRNANKHTQRGMGMLEKSLQRDGWIDAQTMAADGEMISGSARLEVAADKFSDVEPIIIESDGTRPVIVKRVDIPNADDPRARRLSVAANQITAADWSPDGELLAVWGAEDEQIRQMFKEDEWQEITGEEKPVKDVEEEEADEIELLRVPDAVWGTDNNYGVPMLDLSMQATCLEAPFAGWGTMPRKNKMHGTYHFYVEDYRFENTWKNPLDIANSACASVVEPNFSVYDDMPRAVALWQVYRKRWLSRWLQSVGITVFVDLNISERHEDLRLLGVPVGWKAYASRSYSDRLDATEREYQAALKHSGAESILFVVYGGGKKAEQLSKQYGWIWYQDQQTKEAHNG